LIVGPKSIQPLQRRVQAQLSVETQHLARRIGQFGSGVVIGIVGVRDHGADSVVAAVERDDDENAAASGGCF
jgi:hypothetical protein